MCRPLRSHFVVSPEPQPHPQALIARMPLAEVLRAVVVLQHLDAVASDIGAIAIVASMSQNSSAREVATMGPAPRDTARV